MLDYDSWQEIFETVRRNKLRAFLTAFGVFWGIFMLVVMLGMGEGLENGVYASMGGRIKKSMYIWSQRTSMPYKGMQPGRSVSIENADATAILTQIPGVERLSRRLQLGGYRGRNSVTRGSLSGNFAVNGDDPQIQSISGIEMQSGRFLNPLDIDEKRKVAVIGEYVRQILFPEGEDPIGKSIQINKVYFKIVGVFGVEDGGDQGERQSKTIHVPFTTAQQAFNYGNEIGWLAASAGPEVSAVELEERIKSFLKKRKGVHPEDPAAFGSFNAQEEFNKINNLFTGIRVLIWVVGAGTLLAGMVGVINIMLISVRERTREIGLRKALGARPWTVIGMIVREALLITLVSGYLGLLAAVALLELISAQMGSGSAGRGSSITLSEPGINLEAALVALAVLTLAGVVAGLLPAKRAADVAPVVALRSE